MAGIQYRWRGYCQQAGIHITCHQLRHTFARRLAEQQMPTESMAELMGHAQVTTTQRYTAGANLAHTGLRCAELLNLRLSDLDLTGQRLFIVTGKNGDERLVYLTPALVMALTSYLPQRPTSTSDDLWLHAAGQPLTYAQVKTCLDKWGAMCGVPVTAHRLRHTFATQLVNSGMSLQAVAKLLGHRSLNMTQHYARLYEKTVKTQFEAATAHIDGYLATDWPDQFIEKVNDPQESAHLADSM